MRAVLVSVLLFFNTSSAFAQTPSQGDFLDVKLEHKVSTQTAHVGDQIRARLSRPLKNNNREVIVPAGSLVVGRVDFVKSKSTTDDGWMRLLFDRLELPNGRSMNTLASASFHKNKPSGVLTRLIVVPALAAVGAIVGGHAKRVAGGLGGAIAGVVLVENHQRYGHDLTLHAGQIIRLRLSADVVD